MLIKHTGIGSCIGLVSSVSVVYSGCDFKAMDDGVMNAFMRF